jgi:hypothetical protein
MIRFLHQYRDNPATAAGNRYVARAYGDAMPDGRWEGWFVFFPIDGGEALATDRETTQPNERDTLYWARGITPVYLEGALQRALERRPAAELARRVAQAEREKAYAKAELDAYRAAAREALELARAAAAERQAAESALDLERITRELSSRDN